jgi:two-component system KDP operon response regulator KdpE
MASAFSATPGLPRSEPANYSFKRGREVKLTATEYALLLLFVRHLVASSQTGTSFAKSGALKSEERRQYLRVCVTHLRRKIESDPASPSLIKTEPAIGYRLVPNEAV